MSPFSIVPPSHFGRRPRVRLSPAIAGHPFPRSLLSRLFAWVRA